MDEEPEPGHIFMRWKEMFLLPDHRVQNVAGATYAGFYYIAYHVDSNTFDGYYYQHTAQMYYFFFD